jgi:formate hydrogenlyase transcriptional activator
VLPLAHAPLRAFDAVESGNRKRSMVQRRLQQPRAEPGTIEARYQALLEVTECISLHRELPDLFEDLASRLCGVVSFDFVGFNLCDPVDGVVRIHFLPRPCPDDDPAGPRLGEVSAELPIDGSLGGFVWRTQQPALIANTDEESRYPSASEFWKEHGVKSLCIFPLTSAQRRLGSISLGSRQRNVYSEDSIEFLQQVARQVAIAVDNVGAHSDAESYQQQLARERDRLRLLLKVNNSVVSNLDLQHLSQAIMGSVRQVMESDYAGLLLPDAESGKLRVYALDFPDDKPFLKEGMLVPEENSAMWKAFRDREPIVVRVPDPRWEGSPIYRAGVADGFRSGCLLPLVSRDRTVGVLFLGRLDENAFTQDDLDFLNQVAAQVAIAVYNALDYREVTQSRERLAEERLYLNEEIRGGYNFEEIIGVSPALKHVLDEVQVVAPTDSTVLILGETGTGKELIARAIHNLSHRVDRAFVKVNCAAMPAGLLESELFGHEKGAFTGAITKRTGRFEIADKGTIFLDEIGDIPLELQPKLLRVLQEREFERLGSARTQHVDVRLVAATNQDLAKMVEQKQFRGDLYYRLHVFPISLPPLRQRKQDIAILVRHFVQRYARTMNKKVDTIPANVIEALERYDWPGNVRELENFIERAVILSPGSTLRAPLAELKQASRPAPAADGTLEETERAHILNVLRETKWVVGGPRGAAARLGLRRTTLIYKMQKLGISRDNS